MNSFPTEHSAFVFASSTTLFPPPITTSTNTTTPTSTATNSSSFLGETTPRRIRNSSDFIRASQRHSQQHTQSQRSSSSFPSTFHHSRHSTPSRRHEVVHCNMETTTSTSTTGGGTVSMSALPSPAIRATAHDIATGRDPARVRIFDTTLRDGEQSPGATLSTEEKIVIARQLAKLGVDVIEAGFPVASDGDFEAVKLIATSVGCGKPITAVVAATTSNTATTTSTNGISTEADAIKEGGVFVGALEQSEIPIICGLARLTKGDISRCWEAVKHANFPRIHTFIATSDIHLQHKLRKTREQVLESITEHVSYAKQLGCNDIEFSAEDATRSDWDFLCQAFSRAVQAGATTLNIPDTVGYTTPSEMKALVHKIRTCVPGIQENNVILSVHGHDDLGLSVANFMSAIEAGARQVEVTINGIGERAGNAALEEVVMALKVRKEFYKKALGFESATGAKEMTNIKTEELFRTSKMVSNYTGMSVQPNKAIVGANAFAHESGIHQDGVLKNKLTYEIMDAKTIGIEADNIVLGKHSGRHAFRTRISEMGFQFSDEELNRAFIRFKALADKKKDITSWDLESLMNDEVKQVGLDFISLQKIQVLCGDHCIPTATVVLHFSDSKKDKTATATGTGPVDAAFKAVNDLVKSYAQVILKEYSVNSVTKGIDALGEVTVRVADKDTGKIFTGSSANTDIVVASTKAYLNAFNRCVVAGKKPILHPQLTTPAE